MTGQRKRPDVKRLGCPDGAAHLRRFGNGLAVSALKAAANERAAGLVATIEAIRAEGVPSANGIAAALNAREIATPRGGQMDGEGRSQHPRPARPKRPFANPYERRERP